jgi:deazaflavin-dependent oxidoreductase (nitroreductase family)
MKAAGSPDADASIVRHVGRRSGTPYETPVGAGATEDGFVIGLPYAIKPDWVKNVLAAGSAVIVHEGHQDEVGDLEVVEAGAAGRYFSPGERRVQRMYGVRDFLLLRRAEFPAGVERNR